MQLFGRIGVALTVVAAFVQFIALVSRGLAADPVRVPWGNMYEFTLTGTWVVVVGYLLLYKRYSLSLALAGRHQLRAGHADGRRAAALHAGRAAARRAAVALAGDPRGRRDHRDRRVHPRRDVLGAVPGQAALGGEAGRRALAQAATWPGCRELEVLDRIAYRTHAFAFPIWTFAALIAGPIWAHYAWGRYWGWDPKEVWAFITWVVYAAYLHARATSGWKGRSAAIVALVGLATLWFNFVGINFFFGSGSQHSYAAPEPIAVVRTL